MSDRYIIRTTGQTGPSPTASNVTFSPTGSVAATSVQDAIAEVDGDITAHVGDTTAAHAASAISYNGSTNLSATDVESALDELDTEKAPAVLFANVPTPFIIPHRGNSNTAPDDSLAAFKHAASFHPKIMEGGDCWVLKDGSIAIMHDATVDRTTNGTGNVDTFNSFTFRALSVDASTWFGSSFYANEAPPMLVDILGLYGGKIVLAIEAKAASNYEPIVDAIVRAGLTKSVMFNSFYVAACNHAAAAGIASCLNGSYPSIIPGNGYPANSLDSRVEYLGVTPVTSLTDPQLAELVATGKKCIGATVERHYDATRLFNAGFVGAYSNDAFYAAGYSGTYGYKLTSDPFAAQTWYHGMLPAFTTVRGSFTSPNIWGMNLSAGDIQGTLQGWASPIAGAPAGTGTFTIDFTVKWNSAAGGDTTRWVAVDLSPDDRAPINSARYNGNTLRCLVRKNGTLEIQGLTASTGTTLATQTGTLIADGASPTFRISVTPSSVTFQRLDVATSVTNAATGYRGGYMHLMFASVDAGFKSISIT